MFAGLDKLADLSALTLRVSAVFDADIGIVEIVINDFRDIETRVEKLAIELVA